jgi:L-ribulose-5-phosphate 4-epimerase
MLSSLRQHVYELHLELVKYNLVVWTMGNVSARDPETGLVVIKPSGIRYEEMRPEHMVIVDLDANVVEPGVHETLGSLKFSSDTLTHLYLYRQRPDVMGVCHTHSTFATAFAAVGKPIPCFLTGMADEFGGEIPLGGFELIGSEAIGKEMLRVIGSSSAGCRAVIMQNHGLFAIGNSGEGAVKAAVMAEDAARTSFYALQLGTPISISAENVASLYDRYSNVYGNKKPA